MIAKMIMPSLSVSAYVEWSEASIDQRHALLWISRGTQVVWLAILPNNHGIAPLGKAFDHVSIAVVVHRFFPMFLSGSP
jgi:hypothetical protein